MRLSIGGLAHCEQALQLAAVRGQRAAAVGRDSGDHQSEGHVQPDRHAVHVHRRAILGVHEGPAACRDDGVAEREQELENVALDGAEVRFSLLREDVGDGPALACFDQLVDVFGPPAETCGRVPARRSLLPAAMNPTR